MILNLKSLHLLPGRGIILRRPFQVNLVLGLALLAAVTGCKTEGNDPHFKQLPGPTSSQPATNQPGSNHSESMVLREGDSVKITFLGSPNLNNTVAIRRDGKIGLYLVGEVPAAGLTPVELEKELKKRYKDQISVNEITVSVESDAFPIYVTGAVMHPQKVMSNHPITILEAIMEAGGPDYLKANIKAVTVLRPEEGGRVKQIIINLNDVIRGKPSDPFYMKPGDTIIVREKFSWL